MHGVAAGVQGRLILGIRPTDFEHGATAKPELPRLRVRPPAAALLRSRTGLALADASRSNPVVS